MFQHHNYEVSSLRRGSKVIRRYSDFVWLLDCLQKRYPFRVLPLLPPKRVAVNGNHLSNDNLFIEKRRRGLARFLNALVRHPLLAQEQLVVMFLTVPTVCPPPTLTRRDGKEISEAHTNNIAPGTCQLAQAGHGVCSGRVHWASSAAASRGVPAAVAGGSFCTDEVGRPSLGRAVY
jgi:hypothetical protein